jgi:hypothetical protein
MGHDSLILDSNTVFITRNVQCGANFQWHHHYPVSTPPQIFTGGAVHFILIGSLVSKFMFDLAMISYRLETLAIYTYLVETGFYA